MQENAVATSGKSFRFGVTMTVPSGRAAWITKCRKAEGSGYEVIGVADHLGMPSPFPAVLLAAEATERVRVCTYVLNTGFYNPVLLTRDVATTDQLTGGRLELGLGTGYVKAEFDAAGAEFQSPAERLRHLEETIYALRTGFANGEPRRAQQPRPPLLLGGQRDRMLAIAAREADIVGLVDMTSTKEGTLDRIATPAELKERVAFVRAHAGERMERIELNLLIQKVFVTSDRAAVFNQLSAHTPGNTAEELDGAPILLVGTVEQIADQVLGLREDLGISYITVIEPAMDDFAPVIEKLR